MTSLVQCPKCLLVYDENYRTAGCSHELMLRFKFAPFDTIPYLGPIDYAPQALHQNETEKQ